MKLNPGKGAFGVSLREIPKVHGFTWGIEANPDKIQEILNMKLPKNIKSSLSLDELPPLTCLSQKLLYKCLPFFKVLKKAFEWTDECQKAFQKLKGYLTTAPLLSPSTPGEELYLYLTVSPHALSLALIREEGKIQKPIYYTNKALKGAEGRYPMMEKLAFAMVIASKKLRPYFQAYVINVLTDHPLKKGMNKLEAVGRLIRWAIELNEFDIRRYRARLQYQKTNNKVEYEAILKWLELAKSLGAESIVVQGDTQLIMGQVNGTCEAKEERMKKYLNKVKRLVKKFKEASFLQVLREENMKADALAKAASANGSMDEYDKVQYMPNIDLPDVKQIEEEKNWITPIVAYLRDGRLTEDRDEARKLRARVAKYVLIDEVLYKRGFSQPYLRCLDPNESNYVLREVHEGAYENHSEARALIHKIVREGYY
ncbi:uncharacterized protein LOC142608954 [Castanea sativa]|uniref:uncharacterized protein LOC142608954 n=1 Tax=Castanea sativa TaxID=21020 RepID=UPI003F64FA84